MPVLYYTNSHSLLLCCTLCYNIIFGMSLFPLFPVLVPFRRSVTYPFVRPTVVIPLSSISHYNQFLQHCFTIPFLYSHSVSFYLSFWLTVYLSFGLVLFQSFSECSAFRWYWCWWWVGCSTEESGFSH